MSDKEFGQRVAALRRLRGMSQGELATAISRSESWVSQVERGVYAVERISLLQSLADALGVTLAELRGDTPEAESPTQEASTPTDLEKLRLVLSGHPALDALLAESAPQTADLADLERQVEYAWELEHSGRYSELNEVLPTLITDLEHSARLVGAEERPALLALVSRTYQVAAATFARRDEPDASWIAADRSIAAADRSGQPLQAIAGHYRLAHAFLRLNRLSQAEHVAATAANALAPRVARHDAPPEELSLYGAMNLVLALIRARESDRVGARRHLAKAREAAERVGAGRNDFNTEFGPTNVSLHALTVAIEVGDAGEALDIASTVNASGLSPERQGRFWLDVARAHAQRREVEEAIAAIHKAEELAPEQIRGHRITRETVALLVQLSGKHVPKELSELAQRTAADLVVSIGSNDKRGAGPKKESWAQRSSGMGA